MGLNDPRLTDISLLCLAAKRARARYQLSAASAWQQGDGLASLLEASRHLPKVEPEDLPDLERRGPLGALLAEARAWRAEQPDVAGR
jgi:hypothetical protein